jgi:hypothetical protein
MVNIWHHKNKSLYDLTFLMWLMELAADGNICRHNEKERIGSALDSSIS